MLKKILIAAVSLIAIVLSILYIYRYTIIRHYAEKIIRENLPSYVKIDKIKFNFAENKINLLNFRILNPPGFSSDYVFEIGDISCRYKIKGGPIPTGLEIKDIIFARPSLRFERLGNGRINLVEMEKFTAGADIERRQAEPAGDSGAPAAPRKTIAQSAGIRPLSAIIKLPASFIIKDAKVEFLDKLPYDKPHMITIENVRGEVFINFNDNYSKILTMSYTLDGDLNGMGDETIRWTASLDPSRPRLTMSNRFEVSGLDIVAFEPYYDQFSPFIFKKGRFSGTLVFDFDNGNIGSTNEIRISDYLFYVKPGYENAQMWETSVDDLLRYFTTPTGEVVFDFKLKGDMSKPTPYLGPISKRAITSMALSKVASYAMDTVKKQSGAATDQIDKAKGYIDIVKQFMNKK